jgi:hypothetical protein
MENWDNQVHGANYSFRSTQLLSRSRRVIALFIPLDPIRGQQSLGQLLRTTSESISKQATIASVRIDLFELIIKITQELISKPRMRSHTALSILRADVINVVRGLDVNTSQTQMAVES